MCLFGGNKQPEVKEPIKYAQQKTPNRQDTVSAQEKAAANQKKATSTLLADDSTALDDKAKKTLLGA